MLDNAAGGTLLLMAVVGIAGLLRSRATGSSAAAKFGPGVALLIFSLILWIYHSPGAINWLMG